MAEENQPGGGFKVTDRRMFNPDGSLREDAISEDAPTAELPPVAPTPAQKFTAAEITGAVRPSSPPPPPPPPPPHPPITPAPSVAELTEQQQDDLPEQTEFTEFLMRIASEAFIYLGLVEHPMTGRRQVELPAAKEVIDMLLMLRAKTQGNLTPGEARFFEDLLADLQMQFVAFRR